MGDFLRKFAGWGPSTDDKPLVYNKHGAMDPVKWLVSPGFEKSFPPDYINAQQGRLAAYEKVAKEEAKARKGAMNRDNEDTVPRGTRFFQNTTTHTSTLHVSEARVTEELGFDTTFTSAPTAEAMYEVDRMCGRPAVYNKTFEGASFAKPIPLGPKGGEYVALPPAAVEGKEFAGYVPSGGLINDPVIDEIMGNIGGSYPVVISTDEILAALMTAPHSRYSWDVVVERVGRYLILDTRGMESKVQSQWVHETGYVKHIPRDSTGDEQEAKIDTCDSLERESTQTDYLFATQCASKAVLNVKTSPVPKGEDNEAVYCRKGMYVYKIYTLHENTPERFDIIVRCEVRVGVEENGDFKNIRCFGLLQYTPPTPERVVYNDPPIVKWSSDNANSILAIEMGNNKCKIAKWIALAHLSDALLKIGYIARKVESTPTQTRKITHSVVGVQTIEAPVLAQNMKIDIRKMWGNVALIIQSLINDEYATGILKPGSSSSLILFEREDDSDDESDSDESGSSNESDNDDERDSGDDE